MKKIIFLIVLVLFPFLFPIKIYASKAKVNPVNMNVPTGQN